MALPTLYNVPSDPESVDVFAFENADSHAQIAAEILAKFSISLPGYVLQPIPEKVGVWLYNHQSAHNEQNAVLGIQGNDLTDADFSKPEQLDAWIRNHAAEHVQAHQILGLA